MIFDYELTDLNLWHIENLKKEIASLPTSKEIEAALDEKLKEAVRYCFDDQVLSIDKDLNISISTDLDNKIYTCNHDFDQIIDWLIDDDEKEKLLAMAEKMEMISNRIRGRYSR